MRWLSVQVQGGEAESSLNQVPVQRDAFPPEQPIRELGGMRLAWDWEDFSITFNNYGAAEMKVRSLPTLESTGNLDSLRPTCFGISLLK
jgi:hypothetical protein